MHATGDLIGYVTGLLITLLLLVLTLRAARLPGTPLANIGFAVCALLWSAGGLITAVAVGSGIKHLLHMAYAAEAMQFTGVAAIPIPILVIWRRFAQRPWQKSVSRILIYAACATAAGIAILLWFDLASRGAIKELTAYAGAALLVAGCAVSVRRQSTPRSVYLPSVTMACAVCASVAGVAALRIVPFNPTFAGWLGFLVAHLMLLIAISAFLLFARFRYADEFIKYGVRVLIAGAWATVIVLIAQSATLYSIVHHLSSPATMHVLLVVVTGTGLLLTFTFVDERLGRLINRWLFLAPDYRAEARRLANRMRDLHDEAAITAAVEDAARGPLDLKAAQMVEAGSLPAAQLPEGLLDGETIEIDHRDPLRRLLPVMGVEILVPVTSRGRVSHVLLVAPGTERPGLVSRHLSYLESIATQCGNRLDALHREEEAVERQSREALLLQQVTEAELRALRAQINPHFLFNCLNTIADLVVRDPARAEIMTLRLSEVFRHVLEHSNRPLTSIRDEIAFLRTYLYIEEARFGARLQVEIDVAPESEGLSIPSLILQPLVENALKHGLGPKPGPGHLRISVRLESDQLRLSVEDDGMGPNGKKGNGLGLANIAERLRTMYQDRASVSLEPRDGGGSIATVRIPRETAA